MEWDDLRVVLAVARERTLVAAGAALGVSHTTVGRRLRAAEARLRVRLFDRTPEGLIATSAGHELVAVAEGVEAEVLALEGRLLDRDARLRGALRVATMDIVFARFHADFGRFVQRYPEVELTVLSSDREASLTRREADVAIRLSDTPPDDLVGRRVGRVRFAVYGSAALVDAIGADAPLERFPWLHWDRRLGMRWLDDWLAHHAPGARVALRVDMPSTQLQRAVAAGLGVTFLSCFAGDADPALRRIGPVRPEFGRDLWLLTLADLRQSGRVRAFMDHMGDALAAQREVLWGGPLPEG